MVVLFIVGARLGEGGGGSLKVEARVRFVLRLLLMGKCNNLKIRVPI